MLQVRLATRLGRPAVLVAPVRAAADEASTSHTETVAAADAAGSGAQAAGTLAVDAAALPDSLAEVAEAFLADVEHSGAAGVTHVLPQPLHTPSRTVFAGVGDGGLAGWRAAGAAIARAAMSQPSAAVLLPPDIDPEAVGAATEGLLLAAYRYRLANKPDDSRKLRAVTLVVDDVDRCAGAHERAVVTAEATCLARDLTNLASADKPPARLAARLARAAEPHGVVVTVREPAQLAREGFGGILAVGSGGGPKWKRGPRLVELTWRPRGAKRHVVLVGKGITFDTGGISIKPVEGMSLMRKDMGGAATVGAAIVGAARLKLPVRVTALAPLAENAVGPDSYRPGDVVTHYGGLTTEVLNTDAEGRMVLADALAYAARLKPDVIVDLATLTGAARVGLGKRTAALLSDDDALAAELADAAEAAGERVWRLPLADDYVELLASDVADLNNAPGAKEGAGAITAALFLREFLGDYRDRWAHIDMSSTSWSESADGELVKHATGWGVRTLLHWLRTTAA
ncbi:MAG: peptidase M17 [Micromonosporaceae bacterium]|nr:peptidase M17 [Micromonosporaceae bacterium]